MRLITPHVYPLFLFQYRVRYLLILKSGLYPERDSNPHPFGLGFEASASCQFRHRGINRISAYTTHEENPEANVHAHIRLRDPSVAIPDTWTQYIMQNAIHNAQLYRIEGVDRGTIPSTNRYFVGLWYLHCTSCEELNLNFRPCRCSTVSYRCTSESHGIRFLQEPVTMFPPVGSGTYPRLLLPRRLIPSLLYRPVGNVLSHVKCCPIGIRTPNHRSKFCCVTVTPWDNINPTYINSYFVSLASWTSVEWNLNPFAGLSTFHRLGLLLQLDSNQFPLIQGQIYYRYTMEQFTFSIIYETVMAFSINPQLLLRNYNSHKISYHHHFQGCNSNHLGLFPSLWTYIGYLDGQWPVFQGYISRIHILVSYFHTLIFQFVNQQNLPAW